MSAPIAPSLKQMYKGPMCALAFLITELAVLVLAEEGRPDTGQCIRLEQSQSLLEGIVDIDLAVPAHDGHAARSVFAH